MPGARGEATIWTGEREVSILFTNRALGDVEQKLGRGILAVMQGMMDGATGVQETVIMLQAGMEAARRDAGEPGPPVALNTAWKVMDAVGFSLTLEAVMEAVAAVVSFRPVDADGEGEDPNL